MRPPKIMLPASANSLNCYGRAATSTPGCAIRSLPVSVVFLLVPTDPPLSTDSPSANEGSSPKRMRDDAVAGEKMLLRGERAAPAPCAAPLMGEPGIPERSIDLSPCALP